MKSGNLAARTRLSQGAVETWNCWQEKMNRTLDLLWISTKRQQIAKLAKEAPARVFTSLAHLIDLDWLQAAYEHA